MTNINIIARKADDIDLHVGQKIRQLRESSGLTQQDLADILGITFQQVQKYESGFNRVSASRMYTLSKMMNVSVDEFFSGIDAKRISKPGKSAPVLDRDSIELLKLFQTIRSEKSRKSLLELLRVYVDKT